MVLGGNRTGEVARSVKSALNVKGRPVPFYARRVDFTDGKGDLVDKMVEF